MYKYITFLIGLVLTIVALVTPGQQPIIALVGGLLFVYGVGQIFYKR